MSFTSTDKRLDMKLQRFYSGRDRRKLNIPVTKENLLFAIDGALGNENGLAKDVTDNGYDGTLTGSMIYDSTNKWWRSSPGTINFSGVELRQNFTLLIWFKYNTAGTGSFFGQGTQSGSSGLHVHHVSSTSIRFGMFSNDMDFPVNTTTGTWYQYALTYNQSTYQKQAYVNSSLAQSQGGGAYQGTGTFRIGANYSSAGSADLYADIALVAVYNKVLTLSEVSLNYSYLQNRFA